MKKVQKKINQKKDKAQAMIVAFVYISVVSLMGIYMMTYAANLNALVIREINHTKAFYAAEAGLIQAFTQRCNGGSGAVVNMSFPRSIRVDVAETNIGNGYRRLRATASGWQNW